MWKDVFFYFRMLQCALLSYFLDMQLRQDNVLEIHTESSTGAVPDALGCPSCEVDHHALGSLFHECIGDFMISAFHQILLPRIRPIHHQCMNEGVIERKRGIY